MNIVASKRFGAPSPLRYPGGKAALAGLISDVIYKLPAKSIRYAEPYAGGAGAGIALLRQGIIDHLVINDIDPAVYAFWSSVVSDNERFVELIKSTPLNIDEWHKQKETYRFGYRGNNLELGFSFFFLNRTNRSGILNAGVIGGQSQAGKYRINARFNRQELVGRVAEIGRLVDRITVSDLDGRTVIQQLADDESTFMYIDPPYVGAGKHLYLSAFEARDHKALATIVTSVDRAHWLLTYDDMPFVRHLYSNCFQCQLEISYSAHRTGKARELLVASPSVARAIEKIHDATASEESAVS